MLKWIVLNRTDYLHKNRFGVNNLQRLICHKTQQTNQPTNLYGAETWMVYKADGQRVHIYMMCHLHKILNVKWWQYILNEFIL